MRRESFLASLVSGLLIISLLPNGAMAARLSEKCT
jgi:hypothetical protein